MSNDIDPDTLARAALADISMPDDRRAPETEGLATLLRTAVTDARLASISDTETAKELQSWASLQRRSLTRIYARSAR